jgi:hypothetical protein
MDRTTKVLLAMIAAGLWANAAAPLIQKARADSAVLHYIEEDLARIADGKCANKKLC